MGAASIPNVPAERVRPWARWKRRLVSFDAIAIILLLLVVLLVASPSLGNHDIDDLDSAHHLMDGYFFSDLIRVHPVTHLPAWALGYYKQYPALGFIFWPPLFPFVLGLFCLFLGAHVETARICMLCFGMIFAVAFYALLRRRLSTWMALWAAFAAVSIPGMAAAFNQVMLELPTLAFMLLAILAYRNVTDHLEDRTRIGRALLCAIACSAVIYCKQPAWFLYGALAFDFLLLHRPYLRKPEVLIAVFATAILCIPLALFTLKFGRANLAQSVGSNTRLIMANYQAIPRWSLAAWSYYPRLTWTMIGPLLTALGIAALLLGMLKKQFLRDHALWFGWFALGYLTFTFYDNRLPRHAAFWWPAWVALAAAFLGYAQQHIGRSWSWALPLLLILPAPLWIGAERRADFTDFRRVQAAMTDIFAQGATGNILVFGPDRQIFVELTRERDPGLSLHVVRGERLLGSDTLPNICRKYRIGTVLIEASPEAANAQPSSSDLEPFEALRGSAIARRGTTIALLAFRYHGPMDPKMADVSLSNGLL